MKTTNVKTKEWGKKARKIDNKRLRKKDKRAAIKESRENG